MQLLKLNPLQQEYQGYSMLQQSLFQGSFQPNIYSTKIAPARSDANQPEIAVITGFIEFLNACLKFIILSKPF